MKAEGEKQAQILNSEGEKQAEINAAEADKQANILKAEGEARAKVLQAEAEAAAIRNIADAVADRGADPVNYLLAVKYIETLKEVAGGQQNKTVYLPYEASNLLGSLGGIKELLAK